MITSIYLYNHKKFSRYGNMSSEEFLTYQKYSEEAQIAEIASLLEENGIEHLIEDNSVVFDLTFTNSQLNKEFRLKLRQKDFESADALLLDAAKTQIENADENYYLFDFTDEELIEVVTKSDEWSKFDFQLAQSILQSRGHNLKPEDIKALKDQRLEELAKPEKYNRGWIYVGYVFAILGGLFGVFIGWHLMNHKKTLPNGESVYGYTEPDRKHGQRIFVIGLVFFLSWTIFKIVNSL